MHNLQWMNAYIYTVKAKTNLQSTLTTNLNPLPDFITSGTVLEANSIRQDKETKMSTNIIFWHDITHIAKKKKKKNTSVVSNEPNQSDFETKQYQILCTKHFSRMKITLKYAHVPKEHLLEVKN
jgi:hypothetical protein